MRAVLLVASVALLTPVSGASAASCSGLRGPYVLHTKSLKVVKAQRAGRTVYRACDRLDGTVVTSYRARPGERVRFLLRGSRALTFEVTDAARGRTTDYVHFLGYLHAGLYWQRDALIDCAEDFQASQPPPVRTLLAGERFVVVYSSGANVPDAERDCYPDPGQTVLVGFESFFGPTPLDVAPAANLRPGSVTLTGSAVRWLVAGEQRSYAF